MTGSAFLSRFRNHAIHFIIDWDGTLTKKDTLEFLSRIASQYRKNTDSLKSPTNDDQTTQMSWSAIVNAYMEDFTAHRNQYKPAKYDRKIISEERTWLASLKDVEVRSVKRVESSHIFKGVTAANIKQGADHAIKQGGGELQMRGGWRALFYEVLERQKSQKNREDTSGGIDQVTILSVNWSQLFIKECLAAAHSPISPLIPENSERDLSLECADANVIKIYANEIQGLHDPEGSSGMLTSIEDHDIRTSSDKLRRLLEIKNRGDPSDPQPLIYIGDSMTDFECLLEADLGICIRDDLIGSGQRELAEAFDRVGIAVPHIGEFSKSDQNSVVWAQDFQEVVTFLRLVS